MFLKIFRSQQPANFFIIPLIALGLWLPAIIRGMPGYEVLPEMPLFGLISNVLQGRLALVVAFLLLVTQAYYLNFLINKYEVLYKPSFMPALMYILLMSFSRDLHWLHPVIFVNFLLLASFDKAFALFKHPFPTRLLFESSLFIGISFLFYLPGVIFMLLLLLALGIIRSLSIRGWLVTGIGFFLPLYFAGAWFFWNDTLPVFAGTITNYLPGLKFPGDIEWTSALITITGFSVALGLLSLLRLRRNFYKNTIRTRSNQRIFVYTLFAAGVTLLLVPVITLFHLTMFALPMAVFTGYYFLSFKSKPWIGELLFVVYIAAVVWNQF